MAPKRSSATAPKKGAGKRQKRATEAAPKEKKPSSVSNEPSTPSEAQSDSTGSMNWGSVSKMLGYMKYHARPGNQDTEDQAIASDALVKYSQLEGVDKRKFLIEYEKNKGTLKWTRTFFQTSAEKHITKSGTTVHMWNHFQILGFNGISHMGMPPEEIVKLTTQLLADNAAEYEYEPVEQV